MEQPTIRINGKDVPHNTVPWRIATNRHTTTRGNSWGWIEGAPGNICWSNDGSFNSDAASAAVRDHNQWLENQKPIDLKIVEATRRVVEAQKSVDEASARVDRANAELAKAQSALDDFVSQRGL